MILIVLHARKKILVFSRRKLAAPTNRGEKLKKKTEHGQANKASCRVSYRVEAVQLHNNAVKRRIPYMTTGTLAQFVLRFKSTFVSLLLH